MRVNAEKENIPKCGILETPQRRNLPGGGEGGGRKVAFPALFKYHDTFICA